MNFIIGLWRDERRPLKKEQKYDLLFNILFVANCFEGKRKCSVNFFLKNFKIVEDFPI